MDARRRIECDQINMSIDFARGSLRGRQRELQEAKDEMQDIKDRIRDTEEVLKNAPDDHVASDVQKQINQLKRSEKQIEARIAETENAIKSLSSELSKLRNEYTMQGCGQDRFA